MTRRTHLYASTAVASVLVIGASTAPAGHEEDAVRVRLMPHFSPTLAAALAAVVLAVPGLAPAQSFTTTEVDVGWAGTTT